MNNIIKNGVLGCDEILDKEIVKSKKSIKKVKKYIIMVDQYFNNVSARGIRSLAGIYF